MKKFLCLFLTALLLVGLLSACNFNTNYSNSTGGGEMKAQTCPFGMIMTSCLGKMLDKAKNQGKPRRYFREVVWI